mgnify:CR=1 FL=1
MNISMFLATTKRVLDEATCVTRMSKKDHLHCLLALSSDPLYLLYLKLEFSFKSELNSMKLFYFLTWFFFWLRALQFPLAPFLFLLIGFILVNMSAVPQVNETMVNVAEPAEAPRVEVKATVVSDPQQVDNSAPTPALPPSAAGAKPTVAATAPPAPARTSSKSKKKKAAPVVQMATANSTQSSQVGAQGENTGRWTAEEHRLFLQGV